MRKLSIMKPVDRFLIENIDKLVETPEYQKMLDTYNSWEDKVQSAFKGLLLFIIVLIPLTIIMIFWMMNSSAKNRLATAEQIIETGNSIISTSSQVRSISSRYFGKPISTKSNFERELAGSLPSQGIDSSKILIGDFDLNDVEGVNELSAELKFSELSSQNLFGLLNILTIRQKMKIDEINIKKNTTSNLLEGTLSVLHFSPIPVEEI